MEEFERVDAVCHLHHRAVEGECVVDNLLQGIGLYVLAEEGIGNGIGNLLKGHLVYVVEERFRQWLDALWHVETSVFGQSLDDGLMKVGDGSITVGTIVFHVLFCLLFKIYCL